jgi:hypothetical protein
LQIEHEIEKKTGRISRLFENREIRFVSFLTQLLAWSTAPTSYTG